MHTSLFTFADLKKYNYTYKLVAPAFVIKNLNINNKCLLSEEFGENTINFG